MPLKSGASSSSMHTASSLGSSWLDGSPTRHSPLRNGVSSPGRERAWTAGERSVERNRRKRGDTIDREAYESPSRQLVLDFSQMLIRQDQDFNDRLDGAAAERRRLHKEQMSKADHDHERVREAAERERQRILLEQEQARLKAEAEQRRALERLRQQKETEARQRELEEKQRQAEEARQAAEHRRKIEEAEAKARAQKQKEEQEAAQRKQKLEQAEAVRKAQEAAVAAEKTRQQAAQQAAQQRQALQTAPPLAQPTLAQPTPATTTSEPAASKDFQEVHNNYLALHKRMKEFRKTFIKTHAKPGDPLKGPLGEARRNIRLRLGQITVERADSKAAIARIRSILSDVMNTKGPVLDIRPFIISHPIPSISSDTEAQYPALLLYAFICIVKTVMKQFDVEAVKEDGRVIQELGLITASLFADKQYMWNGVPLTDILLAKYHRACPMLFGIRGNMSTAQGKERLGWITTSTGNVPSENDYQQRMLGLGSGFAALSLRSFSGKSPAISMAEYWRAVSSISNTPAADLYDGHFMVLKGLLRDYANKFINFYGVQGRAALRRAVVDLPAKAPDRAKSSAGLIRVLPDFWKVTYKISL